MCSANGSYVKCGGRQSSSSQQQSKNKKRSKKRSKGIFDGVDYDDLGDYGMTNDMTMALLSCGVKPWDDDAWDVLHTLKDYDYF